nr:reverse transcriptase domain-containing protein [Tanacetum cinerariifolium]
MLVEVGKFTFPANIVILDMEEDSKVPLILGRPFLYTANAVIRVKQKQINLRVGTERMIFNIDSAMKHSYSNDDTCFSIDVIHDILEENFNALLDEGSKILHFIKGTLLEEEILAEFDEFIAMTVDKNSDFESDTKGPPFKKITINTDYKIKTSLEEPPTDLKLKPLPDNLEYILLILSKTIHTDNSALRHLVKKQDAKLHIIRWILLLQEFNKEIKDRKGTENVFADHLTRIENDETSNDNEVDDNFLEETLMEINTKDEPCSHLYEDTILPFRNAQSSNQRPMYLLLLQNNGKPMKRYGVNHRFSTSYHPQTSGQVENTNRALKRILEITVKENPAIWSRKLDDALWAFRTSYKTPTVSLENLYPMDDEPMWAAESVVASTPSSTITLPETANEFDIKGNHLTLVKGNQFDGTTRIDPHKHIHEFLIIRDMFKYRDTENEAVRLMMFPLSLSGEAKTWLDKLNEGTIET